MYYILYNPLSNGGTCIEKAKELEERFTTERKEFISKSLLDIDNVPKFINNLKGEDVIIIVGGDGTLYHIANEIHDVNIKNKVILLVKAGTGNDFYRDVKDEEEDGFIRIDQYLSNTPTVEFFRNVNHFNNSCGMGVDGDICNRVNISKKKSALHYLLNCIKAVFSFEKFTLTANVDGEEHTFEKTWFAVVMQGKYFGGGMKVAPDQDRKSDELTLVVAHNVGILKLLFILPKIYSGKHVKHTKYVKIFKCKNVELNASNPQFIEIDGDIVPNVEKIIVKK